MNRNVRAFARVGGAALLALVLGLHVGGAAAQTQPGVSPALPQDGDLTFGGAAGSVLVGLTVRPGQPGPNTLLVYVLPLDGAAAAADVPLNLSLNGQPVPLEFCSRTCRTADVSLLGGEHVDLTTASPDGGTVGFDLPALPAPDGSALLQQVQDRMHRLQSYRIDEVLGPANPPLEAHYAFRAPDRMRMDLGTGPQTVYVGPMRYTRPAAAAGWSVESLGFSLSVPSFSWDTRSPADGPLAMHTIGAQNLNGIDTQVLAFVENSGQTPLWFRLWVDADGLVRRVEMRAQGHFMDDAYTDFDAPFTIDPPPT